MKKKKEKIFVSFFRFVARVWIISMPAAIVLSILLLWNKISLLTAGLLFFGVLIFTSIVTGSVFKELDNFVLYLKKLAQGIEIEPPRFKKSVFSSVRLADSFQLVKKRWFNQTLSDSSILENLPHPLLMIDYKGVVVFMNQRAELVFGKKKENIYLLFKRAKEIKALDNILKNKTETEWFDWRYKKFVFQVRIDRLPALTRSGAIAVVSLSDITLFERLKEQQMEFFANASHELKTPLSIISGMVETLQGPAKNDEKAREQFLDLMAEQTAKMNKLLQDLLKLSRAQALVKDNKKEVINMPDLMKDVIGGLNNKAQQSNKKIVLKTAHKIPRLLGSYVELQSVFQNLIDNAIKYSYPETVISVRIKRMKQIKIRTTKKQDYISVRVHNYGKPIEKKFLDKLFDRFYRGDIGQNKHIEGSGLGLSIVQKIVNDYDGKVSVDSSDKRGTIFTVLLPLE